METKELVTVTLAGLLEDFLRDHISGDAYEAIRALYLKEYR
jgi:hypothetical protein